MGGGPDLCAATSANLRHAFFLKSSGLGQQYIVVSDTLSLIYNRLRGLVFQDNPDGAALAAVQHFASLLTAFAAVVVAGEGLAKGGKVDRGKKQLQASLSREIPTRAGPIYQAVREAQRALVVWLRKVKVQGVPIFDVFGAAGDADGNQAYVAMMLNAGGFPYATPADLEGVASSDQYRLPLGEPLGLEKGAEFKKALGRISAADPEIDADSTSVFFKQGPSSSPDVGPSAETPPPPALHTLSITRDRDRLFADDQVLAFEVVELPHGHWVTYAARADVWRTAARDAQAVDEAWRKSRLRSLRTKPEQLALARDYPYSLAARILASSKVTIELAEEAVGFAVCETGDFSGLKTGSGWGRVSMRRLYMVCGGDICKMWDTLISEGVAPFFVNGWASFILPVVRQTVTYLVPTDPHIAAADWRTHEPGPSNGTTGVYLYQNRVSLTLRQGALQQLLPHLNIPSSLSRSEMDTPLIVMQALHFLNIVPQDGFLRQSSSSSSSYSSSSPSWPFGSGLYDAPVERALFAHRWTEREFNVDSSQTRQIVLQGLLGAPLSSTTTHDELVGMLSGVRSSDPWLLGWSPGRETSGEGVDDEEEDEDEDLGASVRVPLTPGQRKTREAISATRRATAQEFRKARRDRLPALVRTALPHLAPHLNLETFPLSDDEMHLLSRCFEDDNAVGAFTYEAGRYSILYEDFLQLISPLTTGAIRPLLRRFCDHFDIEYETRLQNTFQRYIDAGGLSSPLMNSDTVLPLLIRSTDRPPAMTPREIARMLFVTSGPAPLWTRTKAARPDTLIEALSVDSVPEFLTLAEKDSVYINGTLSNLNSVATVFGLPKLANRRLPPRPDFPTPPAALIFETLEPLRSMAPQRRTAIPTSTVDRWISKLGGPHRASVDQDETVSVPTGRGGAWKREQEEELFARAERAWRLLEDIVRTTVEEEFESYFGSAIDWTKSRQYGCILW